MKFDIIIPMGMYCAPAQALRSVKKRSRSLPFDWIGLLSFDRNVALLENNFKDFFHKEDLERYREDNKKHIGYLNTKNHILFLHDFTDENNFDSEYELIKEKYDRRINRLYQSIADSKNILYVHIYDSASGMKQTKEEAAAALERLQKLYPDKNQHLCFISLSAEKSDKKYQKTDLSDKMEYYECYADNSVVRQEGQPSYVFFQARIEEILRRYQVRVSFKDRCKKLFYKAVDAMARLLPACPLKEKLRMIYKEYK